MTSEPRYMRSDQHTINGLLAYKLLTSNSASNLTHQLTTYDGNVNVDQTLAVDIAKRDVDGNETSIATKVGEATGNITAEISGTWSSVETSLNATDAIVVRVYAKTIDLPWFLVETFITEQVQDWGEPDPTQLDGSITWTFYYHLVRTYTRVGGFWFTKYFFYWGNTTYDSRIENFTWSAGGPPPSNPPILVQIM